MTWAVWLAIPVAATLLAACWSWVRSRPPKTPTTAESMQAHSDYLDALGATARGQRRPDHDAHDGGGHGDRRPDHED